LNSEFNHILFFNLPNLRIGCKSIHLKLDIRYTKLLG